MLTILGSVLGFATSTVPTIMDFFKEKEESFYIYQQIREQKSFIGIIASVSIDEYKNKKIKIHEETITKRKKMHLKLQRKLMVKSILLIN